MSDLVPRSRGEFWVAWRRGSISVRISNLISSPSGVILSEWVRKFAVHFSIYASVLASFPFPSMEEAWSCHIHLRPHGQLILTSVNGLLVLHFPVIFFVPLIPFLKIPFFLPMSLLSSRLLCFRFSFSIRLSALHLPPKWSIPKKKMAPRASVEGNPRSGAKLLNV